MLGKMIQLLGISLIVVALLDVFLTVLYARIGTGISTPCITRGVWWLFKKACCVAPRWRDRFLTFAAPVMLMIIAAVWVQAVMIGGALVIWPSLGGAVQATQGVTPTDFVSAYYYSGDALTTVGNSDMVAKSGFFKLLTVFLSITGMCLITLTVTYLLEVYSALLRRNAFAVSLYHETSSTGDAVEKVMALGPHGDFEGARADLQNIANNLVDLYETHHFFWIVTYFRFSEAHYALSRILLVAMETVTIIRSALSEKRYRALIHCGPVNEIWNSGMHLLVEFASVYLPKPPKEAPGPRDAAREELWRMRYREVIMKLRGASIDTAEDPEAGETQYVSMRREWDRYICGFAGYMAHSIDEIDVALAHLKRTDNAEPPEAAPARLRAAG